MLSDDNMEFNSIKPNRVEYNGIYEVPSNAVNQKFYWVELKCILLDEMEWNQIKWNNMKRKWNNLK